MLEASNVHFGRSSCVAEVVVKNEAGKVCLTATCTMHNVADIKLDDPIVKEALELFGE